MRVKVARSSWREATRIFSIAETAARRAEIAPTLRSRPRLILPELQNASPNRGHPQSPCEEIASETRRMVRREFLGLHPRATALRARDFGSQIDSAYVTDRQWQDAGRFPRRFRFASAKARCADAAAIGPLH